MNDALMKQQKATNEMPPTELSEPHFDEIAVLIAQPVEPIAQHKRDWFGWLEKPRMMIAILVVAGLLGTTALALTLLLQPQPHVDSAATEIKVDESPAEPGSPLGAITEQLESTAPRPKKRKARPAALSNTKPVARRVGVIYGGSSDRP
ncbi:MAG TPA: hypothetical protein VFZ40_07165 [Pyrinomonadaceae bacterium]